MRIECLISLNVTNFFFILNLLKSYIKVMDYVYGWERLRVKKIESNPINKKN